MSSDSLLNTLYQVHIHQTEAKPSPFPFEYSFDYTTLDINKFKHITSSTEDFNNFVKICFDEFKNNNPNIPYGSLHINPSIWTSFALEAIQNAYNEDDTIIIFPNGCCSLKDNCPINIFYLIVLKNILL